MALYLPYLRPFRTAQEAISYLRANPDYVRQNRGWLQRHYPFLLAQAAPPTPVTRPRKPTLDDALTAAASEPTPRRGPGSRKPLSPVRHPSFVRDLIQGRTLTLPTSKANEIRDYFSEHPELERFGRLKVQFVPRVGTLARLSLEGPGVKKRKQGGPFSFLEDIAEAAVRDVKSIVTGLVPGTVHAAKTLVSDPKRFAEETVAGIEEVVTHPHKYPVSFLLLGAGGAGGLLRGVARTRAAAQAAQQAVREARAAGKGRPAQAALAAKEALVRPPRRGGSLLRYPKRTAPQSLSLNVGGEKVEVPLSSNPVTRVAQRAYWRRIQKRAHEGNPNALLGQALKILPPEKASVLAIKTALPSPQARLGRRAMRWRQAKVSFLLGPAAQAMYFARFMRSLPRRDLPLLSQVPRLHHPSNVALHVLFLEGRSLLGGPTDRIYETMQRLRAFYLANQQRITEAFRELDEREAQLAQLADESPERIDPDELDRIAIERFKLKVQEEGTREVLGAVDEATQLLVNAHDLLAGRKPRFPALAKRTRKLLDLEMRLKTLAQITESIKISHNLLTAEGAKLRIGLARALFSDPDELQAALRAKLADEDAVRKIQRKILEDLPEGEEVPQEALVREALKQVQREAVPEDAAYYSLHPWYFPRLRNVVGASGSFQRGAEGTILVTRPQPSLYMPELTRAFTGSAYDYGLPDIVGSVVATYINANRFSYMLQAFEAMAAAGAKTRPLLPDGVTPDPHYMELWVPNIRSSQGRFLVRLTWGLVQDRLAGLSPAHWTSGFVARAREVMSKAEGEDDPASFVLRYVDRRYFRDLFGPSPRIAHTGLLAWMDVFNELARWLILYLMPRYALNIFGNMAMAAAVLGPAFPYWAWRAMNLPKHLSRNTLARLDALMGETRTFSVGARWATTRQVQAHWNTIVDLWFRRMMFLAHADAAGYSTPAQITKLLAVTKTGRFVNEKLVQQITLRANRAAVDFDNSLLTPMERDFVRRIFIFYPWTRSALEWTLRTYAESPSLQLASVLLDRQAEELYRQYFPGGLPAWALSGGLLPVGERRRPKALQVGSVWTPYTFAQVLDMAQELSDLLHGKVAGGDIARALQPALHLFLRPVFDRDFGQSRSTLEMLAELTGLPQLRVTVGTPTFPEPEPLRLVGGGLVPRLVNVARLRLQAEREMPRGTHEYRLWRRRAFKVLAEIRRQGMQVDVAALYRLFALRAEAARVQARKGGTEDIPTLRRVIYALLDAMDRVSPLSAEQRAAVRAAVDRYVQALPLEELEGKELLPDYAERYEQEAVAPLRRIRDVLRDQVFGGAAITSLVRMLRKGNPKFSWSELD